MAQGIFSVAAAKRVAANPTDYTTEQLHAAMDLAINSEAFTEVQLTNLQNKIEAELKSRF